MALKRPAEVHWNFRRPPEPFPQTPGANGCFLAPSGMGKTTTLISMFLGPYDGVFDQIHVFSPSVDIDSAWGPVKKRAESMEGSSFHSEWDEKALRKILDEQREKIKTLKDAKSTKFLPQILTVIDDFADRPDIIHSAGGILTTLFIRGRHFGSSCWLSTQKLTAVSTRKSATEPTASAVIADTPSHAVSRACQADGATAMSSDSSISMGNMRFSWWVRRRGSRPWHPLTRYGGGCIHC